MQCSRSQQLRSAVLAAELLLKPREVPAFAGASKPESLALLSAVLGPVSAADAAAKISANTSASRTCCWLGCVW